MNRHLGAVCAAALATTPALAADDTVKIGVLGDIGLTDVSAPPMPQSGG